MWLCGVVWSSHVCLWTSRRVFRFASHTDTVVQRSHTVSSALSSLVCPPLDARHTRQRVECRGAGHGAKKGAVSRLHTRCISLYSCISKFSFLEAAAVLRFP